LRRAVELKPSYTHALQQLGGVLRNLGRIEESLAYLQEATTLDPLSTLMREGYGLALLIHGDTAAAREHFESRPSEFMRSAPAPCGGSARCRNTIRCEAIRGSSPSSATSACPTATTR
jgi:tetratricopeptide (TPR) repeat protein